MLACPLRYSTSYEPREVCYGVSSECFAGANTYCIVSMHVERIEDWKRGGRGGLGSCECKGLVKFDKDVLDEPIVTQAFFLLESLNQIIYRNVCHRSWSQRALQTCRSKLSQVSCWQSQHKTQWKAAYQHEKRR